MPPSAPALPPAPAVSSEAAPPPPAHRGTRGIRGNLRFALTIAAVLAVLVAVNVLLKFGPPRAGLILSPAVAIVLIVLARRHGLTWDHLGLSRRGLRKGIGYATAAILAVGAIYLIGALLPLTRAAFLDDRYHLRPGTALLAALVVVPLGTVLLEEVAFRGVLLGLAQRQPARRRRVALGDQRARRGTRHRGLGGPRRLTLRPGLRQGVGASYCRRGRVEVSMSRPTTGRTVAVLVLAGLAVLTSLA